MDAGPVGVAVDPPRAEWATRAVASNGAVPSEGAAVEAASTVAVVVARSVAVGRARVCAPAVAVAKALSGRRFGRTASVKGVLAVIRALGRAAPSVDPIKDQLMALTRRRARAPAIGRDGDAEGPLRATDAVGPGRVTVPAGPGRRGILTGPLSVDVVVLTLRRLAAAAGLMVCPKTGGARAPSPLVEVAGPAPT